MDIRFTSDRDGIRVAMDRMHQIVARAEDPRPVLERIATEFEALTLHHFDAGFGWPPLSPQWAASKADRGFPSKALQLTGRLYDSLFNRASRYHVHEVTRDGIRKGTRNPVAHLHDQGARRPGGPGGRLPQRQIVDILPSDEQRWQAMFQDYITGDARGLGL